MPSTWVSFLSWCHNCVLMNRTFHTVQLWRRWVDSISKSISVLFVRLPLQVWKTSFCKFVSHQLFCRKTLIYLILGQSLNIPQTAQGFWSGNVPKMPYQFFICSQETFIMPLLNDARSTFFNGAAVCKFHHLDKNLSTLTNWWAFCVYFVFLITTDDMPLVFSIFIMGSIWIVQQIGNKVDRSKSWK